MNRRKRIVRDGSSPMRRSANMEKTPIEVVDESVSASKTEALAEAIANDPYEVLRRLNNPAPDPLQSPQHRRALRESAKAGIRAVVEEWLKMGADPEDIAAHLEGARVSMMDETRKRGKQG